MIDIIIHTFEPATVEDPEDISFSVYIGEEEVDDQALWEALYPHVLRQHKKDIEDIQLSFEIDELENAKDGNFIL